MYMNVRRTGVRYKSNILQTLHAHQSALGFSCSPEIRQILEKIGELALSEPVRLCMERRKNSNSISGISQIQFAVATLRNYDVINCQEDGL